MDLAFDFTPIARMSRSYADGERIVRHEIVYGLERSAQQIEADAKRFVPILTHTLQRSITHEVEQRADTTTARVGSNLVYAKIAEEGFPARMGRRGRMGKGRKPHPYMKPALDKNRTDITREMTAVPDRIFNRLAAGR